MYRFNFVGCFLVLYSDLLSTLNSIQKHKFSIPTPIRLITTPAVNSEEFQISAFANDPLKRKIEVTKHPKSLHPGKAMAIAIISQHAVVA